MKYAAIYNYPILTMCQFFEVSRSGYYDYARQMNKPDKDEGLAALIGECQAKTNSTYGYRRIKAWITRQTGMNVNHKPCNGIFTTRQGSTTSELYMYTK